MEAVLTSNVASAGADSFRDLARATSLEPFPDAPALIDHLHDHDGSDDGRDQLLAALVRIAKGRDLRARFARDILWLAMWPGLTALLRRARSWGVEDEREILGEMTLCFAETVECMDLGRCTKIAATLILNTRRGLVTWLRARSKERQLERPLSSDSAGPIDTGSPTAAMDAVEDLREEDPESAELIVACVVEGVTTRELAKHYGAERETVKKRLHRALVRLRDAMSADIGRSDVPDRSPNPLIGGKWRAIEEASNENGNSRSKVD